MSCGAKTRSGLPCKKPPSYGRLRCRLHGGASPSGEDHWNFRHGRCTNEARQRAKNTRHELKLLELLMYELEMIAE
jgi:hypothetical protein